MKKDITIFKVVLKIIGGANRGAIFNSLSQGSKTWGNLGVYNSKNSKQ